MLKVQAEINPAIKDASNPFAKSRYATLNSVNTSSRKALLKNGVWPVQYPAPVEAGHLGLMTADPRFKRTMAVIASGHASRQE
jgi:hypothetical protein